jgi:hypothetical protein
VSKKSIEDSSMELVGPVHMLWFFSKVLGSMRDHAGITLFAIGLRISRDSAFSKIFHLVSSNFFLQQVINCYATKMEATIH